MCCVCCVDHIAPHVDSSVQNIRLVMDTKDAAVYDKIQAALDELDEPEPSACVPQPP